jgi:hypothetical protein
MSDSSINIIRKLDFLISSNIPTLLIGLPGVGKTSLIKQFVELKSAALHKRIYFKTLIASLMEPWEINGLPKLNDGVVEFHHFKWVNQALKNSDGVNFIFFDEINLASEQTLAALLRVIHEKVVGDVELPDSTRFLAAINPPDCAIGGRILPAPMISRFALINFELDPDWINRFSTYKWYEDYTPLDFFDISLEHFQFALMLIGAFLSKFKNFINVFPDNLSDTIQQWPCPRTWDNYARVLSNILRVHGSLNENSEALGLALDLGRGIVGELAAKEFCSFVYTSDVMKPEEFLEKFDEVKDKIFANDTRKLWTYAFMVSQYLATAKKPNNKHWKNTAKFVKLLRQLGNDDYALFIVLSMMNYNAKFADKNNTHITKITELPEIKEMADFYAKIMSTRQSMIRAGR